MFSIRIMSMEDLSFAVRLTDTMRWELTQDDFEFMMSLEHDGCFVLFDNSKRIGIVTNVTFGQLGWIGNVIVSQRYRRKGAGAQLIKYSMEYQKNKGVRSIGLYSYINTVPFYEKHGLRYDSEFVVIRGKGHLGGTDSYFKEASKGDADKIVEFDSLHLGVSRKKLLQSLLFDTNNLCYMSIDDEKMNGYVMAKVFGQVAEVGPLVCPRGRNDIAINLLKEILMKLKGFSISMCLPQNEIEIKDMLLNSGFSESFRLARMFYGHTFILDCIFIAESLERG